MSTSDANAIHRPSASLHTEKGIGLATFLGTPVAGALLFADNFRRQGRQSQAVASVLIGALASAAIFGLALSLGDSFPRPLGTLLALGLGLGSQKLAIAQFGESYEQIELGSVRGITPWAGAGIGLAFAGALLAGLFLL